MSERKWREGDIVINQKGTEWVVVRILPPEKSEQYLPGSKTDVYVLERFGWTVWIPADKRETTGWRLKEKSNE